MAPPQQLGIEAMAGFIFGIKHCDKNIWYLILLSHFPSTIHALPIEQTDTTGSVNGIVQPTRAYQAVTLGAFGIIMACHRSLVSEGFTNSRGWGTDALIAIGMAVIAIVWTGVIIASGFLEFGRPCRHDLLLCAGRLIYAPHMLNATILLWSIYSLSKKFRFPLWTPPPLYTRDAWSSAFRFHITPTVNTLLAGLILFLAVGAVKAQDYTAAVMSIVGCAVYIVRAGGSTVYNNTEVPFRNHNFIRAVLNTSHNAGTVYTMSSKDANMLAVWSYVWPNQIEVANAKLLPALRKLKAGQLDLHDLRSSLSESAHAVVLSTTMDEANIKMLARWLFDPKFQPKFADTLEPQPLGRELFYYLYIVELFLFVHRQRLDPIPRKKLCRWRVLIRSGANDIGEEDHYGAKGGKAGLAEAMCHVGAIFGRNPQTDFMDVQPQKSVLPTYDPSNTEGYVGQLWTYCMEGTSSVFQALYIFCAIYNADNGQAKGLHPFQIRADSKDGGDEIAHQIMWRQAWHGSVVAQFTASAVAVAGAVIGGLLV